MAPLNLSIDLLRTFVTVIELGGFSRAGEALGRTQGVDSRVGDDQDAAHAELAQLETDLVDTVGGTRRQGDKTGALTATAESGIYVEEIAGNLRVDAVLANTGNASLAARAGSILDARPDLDPDGEDLPNVTAIRIDPSRSLSARSRHHAMILAPVALPRATRLTTMPER